MQRMDRREFLQAAGAATAIVGVGGLLAACGSSPIAAKLPKSAGPKRGGTLRAASGADQVPTRSTH